jgi:hypothetical protein
MNQLQEFFLEKAKVGDRVNALLQYAQALIQTRIAKPTILTKVKEMNEKMSRPLSDTELNTSIIQQIEKKYA